MKKERMLRRAFKVRVRVCDWMKVRDSLRLGLGLGLGLSQIDA